MLKKHHNTGQPYTAPRLHLVSQAHTVIIAKVALGIPSFVLVAVVEAIASPTVATATAATVTATAVTAAAATAAAAPPLQLKFGAVGASGCSVGFRCCLKVEVLFDL